MNDSDAISGALVADAASMGLHWMYDVQHLQTLAAGGDLLFRPADANAYKDRRAAFVHAGKRAGDLSHYGESARVLHELLSTAEYSTAAHRAAFMETFGPCGSYSGYADRPTKALIARMLTEDDELSDPSGMDDNQMPALCVLPGMLARNIEIDTIHLAAQVISTNSNVTDGVNAVCALVTQLKSGQKLPAALLDVAGQTAGPMGASLQQALNLPSYEPVEVGETFGRACYVHDALPVVWHLLQHASSFESAVRDNVRCGGDSCGRAMVLGAIAGLVFGIPATMRQKLFYKPSIV